MTFLEGVRLAAGGILLLGGLMIFITAVIGNYRFPNAAARMHSAALGDTLGILLVFGGLAVLCFEANFVLKLALILLVFWISGPAGSHLISGMIMKTGPEEKEKRRK